MIRRARPWAAMLVAASIAACSAEPGPSTATADTASALPEPSQASASATATTSSAPAASATIVADGVVSTADEEYRISISPDGATAYFARSAEFFPQARQSTIMETTLVDGEWSEPVVSTFSGEFPDIDPWVAPDGESIYFSSIRPVAGQARRDAELFRVDRSGDGWSAPVHLASLGSERDELGASVSADGTIVFASDRPGGVGGWDLYSAIPDGDDFGEPQPIAELNSSVWEFNPAIDASGTTLIFTSIDREGGTGLGDLFVTDRVGETWSAPRPLAVNTGSDEYHASLSPDGGTLYFVRRAGDGDLYEVDWARDDD